MEEENLIPGKELDKSRAIFSCCMVLICGIVSVVSFGNSYILKVLMTHKRTELPGITLAEHLPYSSLQDFIPFKVKNCEPCLFTSRRTDDADSTSRDVVFATMLNSTVNVIPFVKSLRTGGCNARLIIFGNSISMAKIDKNLSRFFENCGVTVIDSGYVTVSRNDMFNLKHILVSRFLKPRPNLFDRALVVDLYDTVFQADPFRSVHRDIDIAMNEESKSCPEVQDHAVRRLMPDHLAGYRSSNCVNGGTIYGKADRVQKYFQTFLDYFYGLPKHISDGYTNVGFPDQIVMNLMVKCGIFQRAGFNVRIFRGGETFHCMWKLFGWKNTTYELGNFKLWASEPHSAVVHMWDRSFHFTVSVEQKCKPSFPLKDAYIRFREPFYHW